MKLHDFIVTQPLDGVQKLRDLGKALVQPAPLRVSEVARKPAMVKSSAAASDDIERMAAAVATLAGDHKMVHTKIKNYD